ncbi:hypothetical protein EJ04DRAFT_516484 [Polyplosphaeria fusca]|uniref:Uncharacterized protein n=1 Tax=Polyplosphaeria fusca TaxID=682080 RepID=A0A9P4QJT8_9PLEO|nr:hypothetical protein EJ04DRAFT_516484 [Polyplosphaeria fusca]
MSAPLLLPTPLSVKSISLGQVLNDPLDPSASFHAPSTATTHNEPSLQSSFSDVFSHDEEGRFTSSYLDRSPSRSKSIVLVSADHLAYTSLAQPSSTFDALRQLSSFQSFLRKRPSRSQSYYFVTGLQTLRNPTFKRAVMNEGSIAEAPAPADDKFRLPMHVRRDSAMELADSDNDVVFGMDVLKVKCMVGRRDEPHAVDDVDYTWSYDMIGEDVQLSVGLGKSLQAKELKAMAGIAEEEEFPGYGGYYDISDDENDGLAGF